MLEIAEEILKVIEDPNKRVVCACAPSTRVALGEQFGMEVGKNEQGKMVTALKMLGFDDVFDLDFCADLTIMEEANEFAEKLKSGNKFPHLTSCCPAWVKYVEKTYPEFKGHLSTVKSPQQIFGAIVKTYYTNKLNVDEKNIFCVTIMPCLAKRLERLRKYQNVSSGLDVDAVLTVREFGELLKEKNIDFKNLPNSEFTKEFGMASGAGVIFGTTGGVLEAAMRSLSEKIGKKPLKELNKQIIQGEGGIREFSNGQIKVALVSGLANAKIIMDRVKAGEHFDFIEVMACNGGCVNGTGMPLYPREFDKTPLVKKRAKGLRDSDMKSKVKASHNNPTIQNLYKEFLGQPGSNKSKALLHTKYEEE